MPPSRRPLFSAATKTIADLVNHRINGGLLPPTHPLDTEAETARPEYPFAGYPPNNQDVTASLPLHNPLLPTTGQSSVYVGVFVDNFVALAQG